MFEKIIFADTINCALKYVFYTHMMLENDEDIAVYKGSLFFKTLMTAPTLHVRMAENVWMGSLSSHVAALRDGWATLVKIVSCRDVFMGILSIFFLFCSFSLYMYSLSSLYFSLLSVLFPFPLLVDLLKTEWCSVGMKYDQQAILWPSFIYIFLTYITSKLLSFPVFN